MGYLDYLNDDFGAMSGYDDLSMGTTAAYLHDYQKNAMNPKADNNYEYDRFPKNFKYTENFMGTPTNPKASPLDKYYTETYLTNKIRHIEDVYVGSNEAPEEISRRILPQKQSYAEYSEPEKCKCSKCKENIIKEYMDKRDVNKAIEELQKKNELLTFMLIFIVIYCLMQLFYQPRGYGIESEPSHVYKKTMSPLPSPSESTSAPASAQPSAPASTSAPASAQPSAPASTSDPPLPDYMLNQLP